MKTSKDRSYFTLPCSHVARVWLLEEYTPEELRRMLEFRARRCPCRTQDFGEVKFRRPKKES